MAKETALEEIFRLTKHQKKALQKLGLKTVEDLLYHFPVRYESILNEKPIALLQKGDAASFHGVVKNIRQTRSFRRKMIFTEATVLDHTGSIKAVWFHQPYIADKLKEGSALRFSGKIQERNGKRYVANPEFEYREHEHAREKALPQPRILFYPVYAESRGITSRWFYHAIKKIFANRLHEEMSDPLPKEIRTKYHLPDLKTALVWIHAPKQRAHEISARKRFAFEEVFFIQLSRQKTRHEYKQNYSYLIDADLNELKRFVERFPFSLTKSQERAIETILEDFKKEEPMSRLLEGDVGSGKTAVAATIAFAVVSSRPNDQKTGKRQTFGNLQVAYMAPTEILAQQHFDSFITYFSHLPIQIGLITGSGCKKFPSKVSPHQSTDISRAQLLRWVENGEIPILFGTHALIQKTVKFKHLACVVIDEQHRFGISQRYALARGQTRNERGMNAEQREMDAEKTTEQKTDALLYRDLSYRLRGLLLKVKKGLGLGHKEAVYQNAFAEELKSANIPFSREKQIPAYYRNKKVGVYIPDFVIDEKIIIEFKALPFLGSRELKQLRSYLKSSPYSLAFLVNFGAGDVEIKRVTYESARSASGPRQSASVPHLLSMTATPIPRTLALTIFGDLDLTLLDEMPAGRKPVETRIVPPNEREGAYQKVREELERGRQLYVICPRIDEPDPEKLLALQSKSVKAEAERLKKEVFPGYAIEILHSKMRPNDKEYVMDRFSHGEIKILVATSVVEVGVNVPNATMIIIEGAERFGLAQLHQLRGRVLRSSQQAYCFIFTETKSKNALKRLAALERAKNGFELAELDLNLRGAGELSGKRQWGISDIGMEAIKNIKMVETARTEAREIIEKDPRLETHPVLKERISKERVVHFE